MGAPEDSQLGTKPAWLAAAAALAILGLAITVALPVGGSQARSARLSPAASELQGANLHLAASSITAETGSPSSSPGSSVEARRESARHGDEGATPPADPDESSTSDSGEGGAQETVLSAEQVASAIELVRQQFEKLRRADPRAAQRLLESLSQDLAEDPEVVLMLAERAAIATLRNLGSAQSQMQASGSIDIDGDGAGEYGTFAELSGACALRGSTNPMNPPMLSAAFRNVQRGVVERSGYYFAIYLPDATGQALAEAHEGGAHIALFQAVAADRCEVTWCAYAWPVSSQMPGRAFFMNQEGDVLARENGTAGELLYSGADGPNADAAFEATSMPGAIIGRPALSSAAHDGGRWTIVQ